MKTQWFSVSTKKYDKINKSAVKIMIIIFFDYKGAIYQLALPTKIRLMVNIMAQFWKFRSDRCQESAVNW